MSFIYFGIVVACRDNAGAAAQLELDGTAIL